MSTATRLGLYCGVLVLVAAAGWGVGSWVGPRTPEQHHPAGHATHERVATSAVHFEGVGQPRTGTS